MPFSVLTWPYFMQCLPIVISFYCIYIEAISFLRISHIHQYSRTHKQVLSSVVFLSIYAWRNICECVHEFYVISRTLLISSCSCFLRLTSEDQYGIRNEGGKFSFSVIHSYQHLWSGDIFIFIVVTFYDFALECISSFHFIRHKQNPSESSQPNQTKPSIHLSNQPTSQPAIHASNKRSGRTKDTTCKPLSKAAKETS